MTKSEPVRSALQYDLEPYPCLLIAIERGWRTSEASANFGRCHGEELVAVGLPRVQFPIFY
jgi:hypothetical protein